MDSPIAGRTQSRHRAASAMSRRASLAKPETRPAIASKRNHSGNRQIQWVDRCAKTPKRGEPREQEPAEVRSSSEN